MAGTKFTPLLSAVDVHLILVFLGCLMTGRIIEGHALNVVNAYAGNLSEVDAVMERSAISCTGFSPSRHIGRQATSCERHIYFKTPNGELAASGPADDRAVRTLSPGTSVRLVLCKSVFGTSLTQVKPEAPWRRPPTLQGPCQGKQSIPSLMNSIMGYLPAPPPGGSSLLIVQRESPAHHA